MDPGTYSGYKLDSSDNPNSPDTQVDNSRTDLHDIPVYIRTPDWYRLVHDIGHSVHTVTDSTDLFLHVAVVAVRLYK